MSKDRDELVNDLAQERFYELFYWFVDTSNPSETLLEKAERLGIPYSVACLVDNYMEELRGLML